MNTLELIEQLGDTPVATPGSTPTHISKSALKIVQEEFPALGGLMKGLEGDPLTENRGFVDGLYTIYNFIREGVVGSNLTMPDLFELNSGIDRLESDEEFGQEMLETLRSVTALAQAGDSDYNRGVLDAFAGMFHWLSSLTEDKNFIDLLVDSAENDAQKELEKLQSEPLSLSGLKEGLAQLEASGAAANLRLQFIGGNLLITGEVQKIDGKSLTLIEDRAKLIRGQSTEDDVVSFSAQKDTLLFLIAL